MCGQRTFFFFLLSFDVKLGCFSKVKKWALLNKLCGSAVSWGPLRLEMSGFKPQKLSTVHNSADVERQSRRLSRTPTDEIELQIFIELVRRGIFLWKQPPWPSMKTTLGFLCFDANDWRGKGALFIVLIVLARLVEQLRICNAVKSL